MTTPDPSTPGETAEVNTPAGDPGSGQGAWGAVARLLSVQLLAVVAVTAVITGIYALTGPHGDNQVSAGSSAPATASSAAATGQPPASTPPASTPPASSPTSPAPSPTATATAPASPPASQRPEAASRLKVDVLNQSWPAGVAARSASRVRALGWTVGRVADFNGNVSKTTVYYPNGEAKAARELAGKLPGNPRVLPRFSTLSDKRLTLLITR